MNSIAAVLIALPIGFLAGMLVHWRAWRDIFRTRRWLRHGRRISAQFDRLIDYRERFLDTCIGRRDAMPDDERARFDADVAWWMKASEETQRQADEWRRNEP